jgi:2-keto-4-pentenoate hydratase/2-oxohepta-3-ene-1,7-dioic acid hydratase in catechol pathway
MLRAATIVAHHCARGSSSSFSARTGFSLSTNGGVLISGKRVAAQGLHATSTLSRPFSSSSSSGSSGSGGASVERIVRFHGEDGEEHFGVFTDETESKCRIAKPNASGRMAMTQEIVGVEVILPPVDPPAIYCIGLNYADHAKEVEMPMPKYPVVFMKPSSALTGHNSAIVIPQVASDPPEVDYEAELAVVIGREAKNVSEEKAMGHVLGYTIANDVSARRWQGKKGGGQWIRGKSFDTFLPLGPHIVPAAAIPDPHNLKIRTTLNGDTVQDGNTSMMFFTIPKLISFLSQGTTLLPGTVICTGTPAGVGYKRGVFLKRGDVVAVHIEGIGVLRNSVAAEIGGGLVEH